jgi:hypothetical protein
MVRALETIIPAKIPLDEDNYLIGVVELV